MRIRPFLGRLKRRILGQPLPAKPAPKLTKKQRKKAERKKAAAALSINPHANLKISCLVTHSGEKTLGACLQSIALQTVGSMPVDVVAGVSPASAAFNQGLDNASRTGTDILIHLASDVILEPTAFSRLLQQFDPSKHSVVTGRGYDVFNGPDAPCGVWLLNMAAIGDKVRFRDVYKMDMDFTERLEAETGLTRTKTPRGFQIAYHHPVWTAEEMFSKFRYNAGKYDPEQIARYRAFFNDGLETMPGNKALECGLIALDRSLSSETPTVAPTRGLYDDEWRQIAKERGVADTDVFVLHEAFVPLAGSAYGAEARAVLPGSPMA